MQQYRTVRSLQEDLDFLGLGEKKKNTNPLIAALTEDIGQHNSLVSSLNEEYSGRAIEKDKVFRTHKEYKTKVFRSNKEAHDYMEQNKGWRVVGTEGKEGEPDYKVHVAPHENVKDDEPNKEVGDEVKDNKVVKESDDEVVTRDDEQVFKKVNGKKVGKIMQTSPKSFKAMAMDMTSAATLKNGYLLNKEFDSFEKAKEALLKVIGEERMGEAKESKSAESMIRSIMSKMALIEKGSKKTFEDMYPELETEIWNAIDSKNTAKLSAIIKKLDDIGDGRYYIAGPDHVDDPDDLTHVDKRHLDGTAGMDEAVKVQKLKRHTSAERAKERREYRAKRSMIKRAVKKLHHKTAWKKKHKKFLKAKHGRKAGNRKRYIMAGVDSIATMAETLNKALVNLQMGEMNKKELLCVFESIGGICNKFNYKLANLFEESPEEKKLGYDMSYVGKEWDELDNCDCDDNKDLDQDFDFTEIGDEWDDFDDHEKEGDEVEDEYEDENDKDYVGDVEESIMIDMRCMQEDALEVSKKLTEGTITTANAKNIFIQMVNHIIESARTLTLAMDEEFKYVGQDDINDEKASPEKADSNAGKYVGEGEPKDTEGKPEKPEANNYIGKAAPKAETQKPEAPETNAGKYVDSKGEPEEVSQSPTKVDGNQGKYVGAKGEPGEETDKPEKPESNAGKYIGDKQVDAKEVPVQQKGSGEIPVIESEEIPWKNKDIAPILIKAINKAEKTDPDNYKKFKDLLKIVQNAGAIKPFEVKSAMDYIAQIEEDNKYVGQDKPSEVNRSPEKPDSNKGKYVGAKGEPDEEDENLDVDSMKGKHVGEKQGKVSEVPVQQKGSKEVPVIESSNFKTVKLTYDDGRVTTTSVNGKLSDEQIKKYFRIGSSYNFGDTDENPEDKMVKLKKVEILDSEIKESSDKEYTKDGHVRYDFDLTPEGATYYLFKDKSHTDKDIEDAKKWLRHMYGDERIVVKSEVNEDTEPAYLKNKAHRIVRPKEEALLVDLMHGKHGDPKTGKTTPLYQKAMEYIKKGYYAVDALKAAKAEVKENIEVNESKNVSVNMINEEVARILKGK